MPSSPQLNCQDIRKTTTKTMAQELIFRNRQSFRIDWQKDWHTQKIPFYYHKWKIFAQAIK